MISKQSVLKARFLIPILLSSSLLFIAILVNTVYASLSGGFAWGGGADNNEAGVYEGMGWVSFNGGDIGQPGLYGVDIPDGDGFLSGYAWSGGTDGEPEGGYGWISFNSADLASCNPALAPAERIRNNIVGGARILAISDEYNADPTISNSGGYDGCIVLDGVSVGTDGTLDGYAWSSDLGWIDMGDVSATYVNICNNIASMPPGSIFWPGDDTGLTNGTTNVVYQPSDTASKCEFHCDTANGYKWDGSACLKGVLSTDNSTCPIQSGNSSCTMDLEWDVEYVTNGLIRNVTDSSVLENNISSDSSENITLTVDPVTYTLYSGPNASDIELDTLTLNAGCAPGLATNITSTNCETIPTPTVKITADPNIVRSGEKGEVDIEINSTANLTCELFNTAVSPLTINYEPTMGAWSNSYLTDPLTSTKIVRLSCRFPHFPSVPEIVKDARIEVVPRVEEI